MDMQLQNQTYEKPTPAGADIIGFGMASKQAARDIMGSAADNLRGSYMETMADLSAIEEDISALEVEMSDLTSRLVQNPHDRAAQRSLMESRQMYAGLQEDRQYFQQHADSLQKEYDARSQVTAKAGLTLDSYIKAA
ncbi:TPA: hypothetical protein HA265_07870 [Candidatus Woesearchaeota archaeon]|nr:hypothetical protein [Candidatus Woesearchaeota archaeon]